ncbi:MAG: glycine--tRNA ligase [Candidatus Harrisonbacteria bacterium CG10_big_fil_rev_8_21_14_0_10_42_17]|uniref:Glycine--tRNA ligase n=1 Tax=Candidatus Harrisonbacteria bacterium CG10_big_fil_rev_8_21_14_0_10_42_17 TaxID=1974584 RepID=A0A2M6WJ42_9BACT|nr:MAG: glycine--tRNA ligase [Candidatus Harrisonbacteria bacterium CG10_big_fil_rev_8_21_14_0_10_42_17]
MKKDKKTTVTMDAITSLAKRRGFIVPGSEIYGGLANAWDYGPLGVELKTNIKMEWWSRFVRKRADVVGIDSALLMNPKVWEASGHLKEFTDPLVECKKCHNRFRADHLKEQKCPDCGGELTEEKQFNMMLQTFLGPAEEQANKVYFRPETAQGMFVNFKTVLDTSRKRLPFGIAQIGKAFRNEITPGNFIFRTREFEQMEIEYFIRENEWETHFDHWLLEMKRWLKDLGVDEARLHYEDILDGERAHYSKRTVDIEYNFPFGQKELYGLAYRGDFDLKSHMEASGIDLRYTDPETNERFLPHVIEPTWGVDRTVLVAMLEAYTEEEVATTKKGETESRVVMKFPTWLAPIKVAILPLMKKEQLVNKAKEIFTNLSENVTCDYDETQSIGKRYRRQDEIGTPFCVTVDFESLEDNAVTIRERDSMQQERIPIDDLEKYIENKLKDN